MLTKASASLEPVTATDFMLEMACSAEVRRSTEIFNSLSYSDMFSRAWHRLHIFLRLAPVSPFPALCTGCIFPPLAPVSCFSPLCTGCVFLRLPAPVTCFLCLPWPLFAHFPAQHGVMFYRALHRLNFPRLAVLALVACLFLIIGMNVTSMRKVMTYLTALPPCLCFRRKALPKGRQMWKSCDLYA